MKCHCVELLVCGPCSACRRYVEHLHAPGTPPTALYCAECCPGAPKFTDEQRLLLLIALDVLGRQRRSLTQGQADSALAFVSRHRAKLPEELRSKLEPLW